MTPFVLGFNVAQITNFIMVQNGFKQYSVYDMTACVGGDSFTQSFFAEQVEAYELNPETFQCLKNNLEVDTRCGYNVQVNKIAMFCGSSLEHYLEPQTLQAENLVGIIDPPWGGPDFKSKSNIRLSLGDQPIEELTKNMLGQSRYKLVVLKLPKNYDRNYIIKQMQSKQLFIYDFTYRNVFYLFVSTSHINKQAVDDLIYKKIKANDGDETDVIMGHNLR